MDDLPTTNATKGDATSTKESVLHTAAGMTQSFAPVRQICAHLNAFHTPFAAPGKPVEANHYCAHVNEDVRQCLLYDSPDVNARLIGVEYMITPRLFERLDAEERALWHSHVFEVQSGMLVMPTPEGMPEAMWELAERAEMHEVVKLYGKVFHLWQTDEGHEVPLGMPRLMTSFSDYGQFPDYEKVVGERDQRFGVDSARKRKKRTEIAAPGLKEGVDAAWKK